MAFKVRHLHLKTPDPQKTAKWWVENLGAKILRENPQGTGFMLDLDGITLDVTSFNKRQTRPQRYGLEHIAVGTNDFNNAVDKLKANGARFLEEGKNTTNGRVSFFFETPEGVQLQVTQMEK